MSRITLSERIASGFVGLFIGAVIGAALAWLLGVYSHTLGTARISVSALNFVLGTALIFCAAGVLFGSYVGTLLGSTVALLFEVERQDRNPEVPRWLVLLLLFSVVGGVWWYFG